MAKDIPVEEPTNDKSMVVNAATGSVVRVYTKDEHGSQHAKLAAEFCAKRLGKPWHESLLVK